MNPQPAVPAMIIACVALAAASCAAVPREPSTPTNAKGATIVELEGRFAASSRSKGARAAFLEFLAEDSVVLQPGPVWGRAAWEAQGEIDATLDWAPDLAQLSAAGDLGFSTGPWVLTPREEGAVAEGRYLTVWQKTADGWRVVFDGGFGRRPEGEPQSLAVTASLDPADCVAGTPILPGELQVMDLEMSGSGSGPAHAPRVMRRGGPGFVVFHPPVVEGARGGAEIAAALGTLAATTQLWPMGARVAASGDLGFSYGLSAPDVDGSADSNYVHVWCRTGDGWRLLVELRTKLPPPG